MERHSRKAVGSGVRGVREFTREGGKKEKGKAASLPFEGSGGVGC